MPDKKKYLHFVEVQTKGTTRGWEVANDFHECLGHVFYQPGWRKYVFTPATGKRTIFDDGCLEELVSFTREETRKLKATWRTNRAKDTVQDEKVSPQDVEGDSNGQPDPRGAVSSGV